MSKSVPPITDRLVADIDAPLMKQVFDIRKRERKPTMQYDRQADDLGTGFEVFEGGTLGHSQTLFNHPARLKLSLSDKTS